MSATADAPAVDLLLIGESTHRKRLGRTPWLLLGTVLLSAADSVATALLPSGMHLPSFAMVLLSTNVLVLNRVVDHMSWWSFILLALVRPLLGLPLHYFLGQDVAFMAKKRLKPRRRRRRFTGRISAALARRLVGAGHGFILTAIFGFKFVPKPPPPGSWALGFADPVPYAGAAKTRLRWVLLVDVASSVIYLALFYLYGHAVFDGIHSLY